MKKYLLSIVSIFLFSIGFAQNEVIGKITDVTTAEPIPKVTIKVLETSETFTSFDDGRFAIQLDSSGLYTFTLLKEGYDSIQQLVFVNEESVLNFILYPNGHTPTSVDLYKQLFTDEVLVQSTRATTNSPTTFTTVKKEDFQTENLGQDLPFLLENEPSVVVTSDAGAGVGYTSMRIRGSDMSRINFTVNGIPYNDPESQGVFLVNMPDLASSISDIQIQRGVGTSTNGAGSFGGSVNINTNSLNKKPYAELANSLGSFKTFKHTLNVGSGLLNDKFTFDARLSKISSDGYIDRASADLMSYYLSAGYYDKNTIMRFNHFSGKEVTYQSWNGTDRATLETDRTFNSAGTDFGQKEIPYDNEVDNYKQDHYQYFVAQQFKNYWTANLGLHYTKGRGYFEQYKVGQSFEDYNLQTPIIGNDTIQETDLIRRRWLDNDFYGTTFSLNYEKRNKVLFVFGGAYNQYIGDHFGEIIWAQNASNSEIRERYYDNTGRKTDLNFYSKVSYNITPKLIAFGDLQYRRVTYHVNGIDNDQRQLFVDQTYNFFNPKVGLTAILNRASQVYASYAVGSREPTRNDFIDAASTLPEPEIMNNVEAGYRYKKRALEFTTNYFLMMYNNQLVLTGELNDVGSAVRTNVDKSYRTGIETAAKVDIVKLLTIDANVAWSVNEINELLTVNTDGAIERHDNTKISYSPQWVGALNFQIMPYKGLKLAFINKFVGKQFLDNTTNNNLALNRYAQHDIQLSYNTKTKLLREIEFTVLVNNYTNRLFESNGYVYFGEAYFYPQAGANFLTGLRFKF